MYPLAFATCTDVTLTTAVHLRSSWQKFALPMVVRPPGWVTSKLQTQQVDPARHENRHGATTVLRGNWTGNFHHLSRWKNNVPMFQKQGTISRGKHFFFQLLFASFDPNVTVLFLIFCAQPTIKTNEKKLHVFLLVQVTVGELRKATLRFLLNGSVGIWFLEVNFF